MGRKNVLLPVLVITNGDMSQASLTSSPVYIQYEDSVCFQCTWTGTPTGTFDVRGSLDGNTWISITLSSPIVASGAAGSALIDLFALSFPYIELVYTKTSGTGSLNVLASGKNLSS